MDPSSPCPIPLERSVAALRLECGAIDAIIENLRADDLAGETRVHGWSVQLLLAVLVRSLDRLRKALTAPEPPRPDLSWLDFWEVRDTDRESAQRRARSFAESINDRPVLTVWTRTWNAAVEEAAMGDPARVLIAPGGAIRLDHYATTRVLEVMLHGLDLRHAVGLEEVATPLGLEVGTAVLEALLGRSRPSDLVDDVRFVLAATGREAHPDPRLPVLR